MWCKAGTKRQVQEPALKLCPPKPPSTTSSISAAGSSGVRRRTTHAPTNIRNPGHPTGVFRLTILVGEKKFNSHVNIEERLPEESHASSTIFCMAQRIWLTDTVPVNFWVPTDRTSPLYDIFRKYILHCPALTVSSVVWQATHSTKEHIWAYRGVQYQTYLSQRILWWA